MERTLQQDGHPMRRPRTPDERRALWKEVQQIWRKRSTDAREVLAKMRDEWERDVPTRKQS